MSPVTVTTVARSDPWSSQSPVGTGGGCGVGGVGTPPRVVMIVAVVEVGLTSQASTETMSAGPFTAPSVGCVNAGRLVRSITPARETLWPDPSIWGFMSLYSSAAQPANVELT